MAGLAHSEGEPRVAQVRAHLPAYLVGVGATTALTAAALVAFLSIATYVAFNGFPFGASSNDAGAAYLDADGVAEPTATAAGAALRAASAAVAARTMPGFGSDGSGASGAGSAAGGAGGGGAGGPSGGDPGARGPGSGAGGAPTSPPAKLPGPEDRSPGRFRRSTAPPGPISDPRPAASHGRWTGP
jgi:hypothetical protein